MRGRGERGTDETIMLRRMSLIERLGVWIPDDMRILKEIDAQKAATERHG